LQSITESIGRSEKNDTDTARGYHHGLTLSVRLWSAVGRDDQAISGTTGAAGFDSINVILTQKFVRVFDFDGIVEAVAEEMNHAGILGDIEFEGRIVIGVAREAREVLGRGVGESLAFGEVIHAGGIQKQSPLHE
jgi:hypothetical protein